MSQFLVHKLESCQMLREERNVCKIGLTGLTGKHQPLDVDVNKPFKTFYWEECHKWRSNNVSVRKSGYFRKPGKQDLLEMVSVAWDKVSAECVRKSFAGTEIVTYGTLVPLSDVTDENENSFLDVSVFNQTSFCETKTNLWCNKICDVCRFSWNTFDAALIKFSNWCHLKKVLIPDTAALRGLKECLSATVEYSIAFR